MPRFFVDKNDIFGDIIKISGSDARHIKTVLRYENGQSLTICDGCGNDYNGVIESIEDDIKVKIIEQKTTLSEPKTKITLYQSLPKSDKMELIIQKCVELGVYKIVPVITERVIVKLNGKENKKIERWQKISESAAKQSGRGIIPEIGEVMSFKDAILKSSSSSYTILPYEMEQNTTFKELIPNISNENVSIFIGPEGGFSNEEIQFAISKDVKTVSLGKRILRTETAGIAALTILLYELE